VRGGIILRAQRVDAVRPRPLKLIVRCLMRFTLTQRVLICLAFGLLASCGVLSFDHSAKVSKALLYDANGKPDDAAFTAAMNARFPPGAKSTDVQGFIVSIGGSCSQNTPTQMYCHVSSKRANRGT
jgi:hypothetical protein